MHTCIQNATELLQNAAEAYYKGGRFFIKRCDSFITRYDSYYKMQKLLQNATIQAIIQSHDLIKHFHSFTY